MLFKGPESYYVTQYRHSSSLRTVNRFDPQSIPRCVTGKEGRSPITILARSSQPAHGRDGAHSFHQLERANVATSGGATTAGSSKVPRRQKITIIIIIVIIIVIVIWASDHGVRCYIVDVKRESALIPASRSPKELSNDRDLTMAVVPTSSAVHGSPHHHASIERNVRLL